MQLAAVAGSPGPLALGAFAVLDSPEVRGVVAPRSLGPQGARDSPEVRGVVAPRSLDPQGARDGPEVRGVVAPRSPEPDSFEPDNLGLEEVAERDNPDRPGGSLGWVVAAPNILGWGSGRPEVLVAGQEALLRLQAIQEAMAQGPWASPPQLEPVGLQQPLAFQE